MRFLINFFVAILLLAGCDASKRALNLKTEVLLNFTASTNINPDSYGQSLPLVMRAYELKGTERFLKENFIRLYDDDKTILGEDLINKIELKEIMPGSENFQQVIINDDRTTHIGLMAEFIQYDKAQTRVVIPIEKYSKNNKYIWIDELLMEVSDTVRKNN